MKRALTVGMSLAALCAAGLPAQAGMADPFEAQYEGHVERDRTTWFGFDVIRRDGKRKVARVKGSLPYNCDDGDGGRGYGVVRGRLTVGERGRFGGKLEGDRVVARGADDRLAYDLEGRLGSAGRARGTVDAVVTFTSAGRRGTRVRCYTGELDWRARRGADADPVTREGSL